MEMKSKTVTTNIESGMEKVWEHYTLPRHIINWNFPDPDWQCNNVENLLKVDGSFSYRMEEKVGDNGFEYSGTYTEIVPKSKIEFNLKDGRKVTLIFEELEGSVSLTRTFEVGSSSELEDEQIDWQAVLDNFRGYVMSGQKD